MYNPLDKLNLAKSIQSELLSVEPAPLAKCGEIQGAGIYVIYYRGAFAPYAPLAEANAKEFVKPIYIGKAIPKGGRKGGLSKDSAKGKALSDRLGQHAESVDQVANLKLEDFYFRHLVVDDVWIPLGENMLITTFGPVWNRAIDGFGNKDPGKRRATQFKSPWDVLHPGRKVMEKLADSGLTSEFLVVRVADFFAGRPLQKLPKAIAEQVEAEQTDAEESADEA